MVDSQNQNKLKAKSTGDFEVQTGSGRGRAKIFLYWTKLKEKWNDDNLADVREEVSQNTEEG